MKQSRNSRINPNWTCPIPNLLSGLYITLSLQDPLYIPIVNNLFSLTHSHLWPAVSNLFLQSFLSTVVTVIVYKADLFAGHYPISHFSQLLKYTQITTWPKYLKPGLCQLTSFPYIHYLLLSVCNLANSSSFPSAQLNTLTGVPLI